MDASTRSMKFVMSVTDRCCNCLLAMRPSRCRPGNEIEVSQSRLSRWLSKTRPNGRFVAVAGPRVFEISDLGSLCPASARVRLGLAGMAGVPVMARGSVIEGGRDPLPPTRYDR